MSPTDLAYKVVFLPQSKEAVHPYQKQLSEALIKLGIEFEGANYQTFFCLKILRERQPIVLHLHWLHAFLVKTTLLKSIVSTTTFLAQLILLRICGVKIVWTIHNLKNHENKSLKLDQIGASAVARISHAAIAHCNCAKQETLDYLRLPSANKVFVVPHGNFTQYYSNTISRAEARKALNIAESDFVFLFLGLIRSYKGVPELLAAFEKLDSPNARLVIAGKVHEEDIELEDLLHQKASEDQSIQFIPGFVPDEDIQIYMNAADTVVFPYRDILTSGAVLLAMSFGQSCVAPRIGCISETLDSDGAFLYDPQLDSGLLEAIQKSIRKRHDLPRMGKHNMRLAEGYSWERIAKMTQTIYRA